MHMKKTFLISLLSLSTFFVMGVMLVYAACPDIGSEPCPPSVGVSVNLINPFKGGDSLFVLLKTIISDILLPIGGVLAVLAFIYSGFLYVTAQGNESKLATAHKALLYTSIGTAVLLGSWVLANLIW